MFAAEIQHLLRFGNATDERTRHRLASQYQRRGIQEGNFTQPLRIDALAKQVNMSTSTLHHHFRALTAKSPLQYQKWLRLHEARRLMLTEHQDVASAAFEVGYESPSQFSREYHRLFGAPPLRDISYLRNSSTN
ncbi:helix-turn-helix transcriptional regulator [Thiothrix fructosivorans]|uniref:Helix-turn-helix transcriptional regulator n=2 Tax=Thiothrix fructosivorans TaxID=111770 RepID=A0A8B0SHJ2_9GAMM|nr:helix-turn-helix transcriptional regulator [Thiothrix fructosivorans]QTX11613.1 helix-turn-helix transcriptional regulator [Thiothrix fructosivorans]